MEHTEGIIENTTAETQPYTHPYEYEQAANSYLMAVVAVIAGLPLPIINLIATAGYYLAQRKSSYFVRWHCIQAALGQIALIPFNSIALAWTLGILFGGRGFLGLYDIPRRYYVDETTIFEDYSGATWTYWLYIAFIIMLNIAEFIVVIVTASQVRKGHNVRWWGIAPIADRLTSKEDRNPYKTAILIMKLVFASNNKNKLQEIRHQLPDDIELLSLEDIGCHEDIPETADTIEGNAILKADYVTQNYGYNCFADDTGLEVDALNGAPGVYSARYAGEQKDANDNMDKLLHELEGNTNRDARFKTVIALNLNGKQHLFTGIVNGIITTEKAGKEGFGYDPVFRPEGLDLTFAQISLNEKARLSHRGRAVAQLIDFLKS